MKKRKTAYVAIAMLTFIVLNMLAIAYFKHRVHDHGPCYTDQAYAKEHNCWLAETDFYDELD